MSLKSLLKAAQLWLVDAPSLSRATKGMCAAILFLALHGGCTQPMGGLENDANVPNTLDDYYIVLNTKNCIAPTELPSPWKLTKSLTDGIELVASPKALNLVPSGPLGNEIANVKAVVSITANRTHYLIASPSRLKDNFARGITPLSGRVIEQPGSAWRFEETRQDSFIDRSSFAQCKASPDIVFPTVSHVLCQYVEPSGAYYISFVMSKAFITELPRVTDAVVKIASEFVRPCLGDK